MNLQGDILSQINIILKESNGCCFDYISDISFLSEKMTLSDSEKAIVNRLKKDNSLTYIVPKELQLNQSSKPMAFIILGAIGSGKSTIARILYSKNFFPEDLEFLCEDLMKTNYFNEVCPLKNAYRCAKRYMRYKINSLLQNHQSFVYELVPSNNDKLNMLRKIKKSGYKIISIFLCTSNEEVNLERVKNRMALGADFVSSGKIISRFYSTQKYFADIAFISDFVYLVDSFDVGFQLIGYSDGKQIVMLNK